MTCSLTCIRNMNAQLLRVCDARRQYNIEKLLFHIHNGRVFARNTLQRLIVKTCEFCLYKIIMVIITIMKHLSVIFSPVFLPLHCKPCLLQKQPRKICRYTHTQSIHLYPLVPRVSWLRARGKLPTAKVWRLSSRDLLLRPIIVMIIYTNDIVKKLKIWHVFFN